MKYLTQKAKEELYQKHKGLLEVVWNLFQGVIVIKDLKQIMRLLNPGMSEVVVSLAISELEQNGFLQTKQLFNSNMKRVVITKRAVAVINHTKSNLVQFSDTNTLIVRNLFKAQALIEDLIPKARVDLGITKDNTLSCSQFINYLNKISSSICYRPGQALLYYQYLNHYHKDSFGPDLYETYHYVDICQKVHRISFSKTDEEVTEAEIKFKEDRDALQKSLDNYQRKRLYYNIDNVLKTDGAIIRNLNFLSDRLEIHLYYFHSGSAYTLPDKVADLTAYLCHFFRRVLKENLPIKVFCQVLCVNEEQTRSAEKELLRSTFDIYNMRKKYYNRYQNLLINRSILTVDVDDFSISVENLEIEDKYRITM